MAETLEPSLVGEIDTSAPFESVREAATHFGGFGFWKPSSLNISEASQVLFLSFSLKVSVFLTDFCPSLCFWDFSWKGFFRFINF